MGAIGKKVKLIHKTSKTFLRISGVLMLLSTVALYFYVKFLLQREVEEELRSTEARIESVILAHQQVYQLPPMVEIQKVDESGFEKLKDTLIFDPSQNEMEAFRELSTYTTIQGQNYRIIVRALIVESEDILVAIVVSYVVIIALVFMFLFYMNKARNMRLWYPFFKNLEEMKKFSIASNTPIALQESDILEFSELNTEIISLTNKVRSDYKNLKQYTEDVSHELQTPLAIIRAKIENIINGNHLNEVQYEHLTSIQTDIFRLTQTNKRLALLTKIENGQFVNPELLSLNSAVRKRLSNFHELFPDKIKFLESHALKIKVDPYLADVLVDNLLSNALKHSTESARIQVQIIGRSLLISNEGVVKLEHPEKLFSRFYRESHTTKSTGLGLAIVKQICDMYGYTPSYAFIDLTHVFQIDF